MACYFEVSALLILAVCWCTFNAGSAAAIESFDDLALENDACVQRYCGYATDRSEMLQCAALRCSMVKKWIDTTHYSEGRRSVLDSLERCIRNVCHGKGGMSLKQCAFACSEKRKRSGGADAMSKKWVDPLNYGMGDEKRSTKRSAYDKESADLEKSLMLAVDKVCDRFCNTPSEQAESPVLCQLGCQEALGQLKSKWHSK